MTTQRVRPAASAPRSARLRRHVDSLTGLRALAALLVVGTHAGFWTGKYTPTFLGYLYARMEIGVTIFFVLSGYLLFRPWVAWVADGSAAEGDPAPSMGRYFWHRARRILPAYWLVVITVYLVYRSGDAGTTGLGADGFARNMTLTQIYGFGHMHVGLTQMWSLAVEVGFYLVLPFLGWVIVAGVCRGGWHPARMATALLVLVAVTPAWTVLTHHDTGLDITARLWLPGFLSWFAGGMLLAVGSVTVRRCSPLLCGGGALACFLMACTHYAGEPTIVPNDTGEALIKSFLYLGCAVLLMAPLVLGGKGGHAAGGPLATVLSWRPIVWLGEISYEIFLVHVVVIDHVVDWLGYGDFRGSAVGAFEVTVLVSIPIAWALHRVLDRLIS